MARDRLHERNVEADNSIYQVPVAGNSATAEAWQQLQEFAESGKGSAKEMPLLLKRLPPTTLSEAGDLLRRLAKRMNGSQFLVCAAIANYKTYFAIRAAFEDSSPPPSDSALREYLREQSVDDIAMLEEDPLALAMVRKVLTRPLGDELPAIASLPAGVRGKREIVRWFIDSTPIGVSTVVLASAGSKELAATLDSLDRWTWLEHLHIGGGEWANESLRALRATTNAGARLRLDAILKNSPDPAPDNTGLQQNARAELETAVHGDLKTPDLLDMTARAGVIPGRPEPEMFAKMRGRNADDALQFCLAGHFAPKPSLELLVEAPGVTLSHLQTYLYRVNAVDELVEALAIDRLRSRIRKIIGRDTSLMRLIPDDALPVAHPLIVKDEALWRWALEANDPRTTLFVAAGTLEAQKQGLAHVKRERGLDWIFSLSPDVPSDFLRRLALAVTGKHKQRLMQLIGDAPITAKPDEFTTGPLDPTVLGVGDRARFDVATRIDGTSEEDILKRIGDLEADERAAVARDATALSSTLSRLEGDNLLRGVYTLAPTLTQLFATTVRFEPRLIGYVHSRSAVEQVDAASRATMTKRAKEIFVSSPFLIFAALREASGLAKALSANATLLEWILADAEPNEALSLLSRDPVRKIATAAFEENPELYNQFPKYRFLLPQGRAGVDAIVKGIGDPDARDEGKRFQHNESTPDKTVEDNAQAVHSAADRAHLWDALLALSTPDANGALALVRQYPKDQLELISGAYPEAVSKLRKLTHLSPQLVFPQLGIAQLLNGRDAADWLLKFEAPFIVLRLAAGNVPALRQLARLIDGGGDAVTAWLAGLPRGATLEPVEQSVLDDLRPYIRDLAQLQKLFALRFGVSLEGGFNAERTAQLWAVLRRLPPAQIQQEAVEKFEQKPKPGAAGYWSDPNVVLSAEDKDFAGKDATYDKSASLTKPEIMAYYGLDEAAFQKAIDPHAPWIVADGQKFRVKKIEYEKFKGTVLHEVGHSIDTLLGKRTDLIYSLAGFKTHGLDEVEAWASDMNALEGLPDKHKEKVIEVWRHALRSRSSVKELVPEGHPAIDPSLKHVPLVAAALDGSIFDYKERRMVGDRVGTTGNNQGNISTIPKATVDVAPSEYSLYAPAEFFAESYVEYYRDFDGTSATAQTKGGRLAPWIKKWFDEHVDKIELNPQRYAGNGGGVGGGPNPVGGDPSSKRS